MFDFGANLSLTCFDQSMAFAFFLLLNRYYYTIYLIPVYVCVCVFGATYACVSETMRCGSTEELVASPTHLLPRWCFAAFKAFLIPSDQLEHTLSLAG